MRLTLLGTQGWIPTGRRETTCLAVDEGELLLLFDAGTGLRRLLEPPANALLAARELHLFLSHYHLDHVCGLAYLPAILAGRRLTVHVPEMSLTDVDPERGIADLIRRPYNPRPWHDLPNVEIITEVLHAGVNEIAGHEIRVRRQWHPDATVGYRLDDALAFCTDTVADEATAGFAAGAGLLLHEAWIDGIEESEPDKAAMVETAYASHTSARQAAAIAARAGVGELNLIHLNPLMGEDYYLQMERSARATFTATTVRPDLSTREL